MLFNSIDFVVFLPIIFFLYWFVAAKSRNLQNVLVVVASYVFYGWWDWRFLSLILISTLVDYFVGLALLKESRPNYRKLLLTTSLSANLGMLGFFKYYNFFAENFTQAFTFFGGRIEPNTLDIILPVGISFYTFQTLSYTIDIYRRKIEPTSDFVAFAAFVSFFPQLVAGPIERASRLLPQFCKTRSFDYSEAVDGCRQILWGVFKKVVIADNCAEFANLIFNNHTDHSGSTLILGAFFFSFQIYGDFSGYSDIAIGTSRLFGIRLMKNFAFPYFSRDIAEFWRRWHISLSTWFRDYLYIPLGGSRAGTKKNIRNIFIIFVVSGFWHGANWTFIIWGALNAVYFLPLMLSNNNRNHLSIVASGKTFASIKDILKILVTFCLTMLAWVFFRAENIGHALSYLSILLSESAFNFPHILNDTGAILTLALIIIFIYVEWMGREREYAIEKMWLSRPRVLRWTIYGVLVFSIGMYMQTNEAPFIYFQF